MIETVAVETFGSTTEMTDFREYRAEAPTQWTRAAMDAMIEVADGQPVVIVLDQQTGFTVLGSLRGTRKTPGYGTFQVCVESLGQRTWYPLWNVRNVTTFGVGGGKFAALKRWQEIVSEKGQWY